MESPSVICVVGPTASGKSDLAQTLAQTLDGEVVSADSMQIYRGMDIGTGKLLSEERKVPHFGLDLCDPGSPYSAALYQPYARACFADIAQRNKKPILCGGTGLYIRSAIDDFDFPKGEQQDNPTREYWTAFAETYGAQALWEELQVRDQKSATLIHPNNVRRVVRAFEMMEEGTTYAEQHAHLQVMPQAVPAVLFGLEVSPEVLARRIDKRVDTMVESGLVDEVKSLLQQGFRKGITAPQAIGYKEIVAVLDGERELDDAIEQIKTATRRYAKRQRTWFRKDHRIMWLPADSGNTENLAAQALTKLARP
ncbi:MAG: tRNA (adenosine(37)-N6)-dimethylallyltransferase MiaA [Raoultibacter sp.]